MIEDVQFHGQGARDPRWLPARHYLPSAAPAPIWDWLLDATSLTRRLQRICADCFHVRVLGQYWGYPLRSEGSVLAMRPGRRALLREVLLLCGDTPWVYARTVIPALTLRGPQRRLAHLGSKPLGAALFADPHMRRGEVEVARLVRGQQLPSGDSISLIATETLWGRRSLFWVGGKPLLVSEFFLPALLRAQE